MGENILVKCKHSILSLMAILLMLVAISNIKCESISVDEEPFSADILWDTHEKNFPTDNDYEFMSGIVSPGEDIALSREKYIVKINRIKKIHEISDFIGYVDILLPEDALRYVRLLTSTKYFFLIEGKKYYELISRGESDKYTDGIVIDSTIYEKYSMAHATVSKDKNTFNVIRYLVTYGDNPNNIKIVKVMEIVGENGEYTLQVLDVIYHGNNMYIELPVLF